jgi:hypothetical protein
VQRNSSGAFNYVVNRESNGYSALDMTCMLLVSLPNTFCSDKYLVGSTYGQNRLSLSLVSYFNQNLNVSTNRLFEKAPNIKFHEGPLSGFPVATCQHRRMARYCSASLRIPKLVHDTKYSSFISGTPSKRSYIC